MDIHLRAADEAALAGALPQLRTTAADGTPGWLTAGARHVFDPIGELAVTAPVLDTATGAVLESARFAEGWHANLRLDEAHPDHDALLDACAPFIVHPEAPRRIFA